MGRRPDLFGSPPGNTRSPKRRSGGQPPSLLNRVLDEREEDEGTSDLTQYLSVKHQKGPRNIFDEDEDEQDEKEQGQEQNDLEEINDPTVESMMITQTITAPPQASYQSHQSPVIQQTKEQEEEELEVEEEEDYTMEEDGLHAIDDDAMQITQELPFYNTAQSPLRNTMHSPLRKSPSRDYTGIYSPHHSFYLHDKSPLHNQKFNQSVESTDRMFSFHAADDGMVY